MKILTKITYSALTLICFGLLPKTEAVIPPPDGGYGPPSYGPGNTAEGQDALLSLTPNGFWNTALGFEALYHDTSGSINTATGVRALFSNTSGTYNAAYGYAALYDNTTGSFNTACGSVALANSTEGVRNTATGYAALNRNIVGNYNTANGYAALYRNEQSYNTATGYAALYNNTVGVGNTATGYAALYNHEFFGYNTAIGYAALYNGGGEENTAIGSRACYNGPGGFLGENTAIGSRALYNGRGDHNTAIGSRALYNNSSGSNNMALGHEAGSNVTTANNVIAIGAAGVNASNSCFIGNIWNKPGGSQAVYINSGGKLGLIVSSVRFKDEIKPINRASEVIYGLKPVSFRYKSDIEPARPLSFGLIAEEVEKINTDLVTRDKDGKPLSVRYDQVNAMLLNEFLKEHKTVQELKAMVAQQKQQIDALTAGLQKVSAQMEISKVAQNVARNNE
jgi:hypothetical protein